MLDLLYWTARYRLDKLRRRPQPAGADGLPVPPPELRTLVSGDPNYAVEDFLAMGRLCADQIRDSLRRQGADLASFGAILDFGCGCGRTVRNWAALSRVRVHGTDYNARLVGWCKANLPFSRFALNQLGPPLRYADSTFDLAYAFSVFTHLPEDLQRAWMNEFRRILKPGGFLILSTMPEASLPADEAARAVFRSGRLLVLNPADAGANSCLVFHPPQYLEEELAPPFQVLETIPGGVGQDFWLLRKPA